MFIYLAFYFSLCESFLIFFEYSSRKINGCKSNKNKRERVLNTDKLKSHFHLFSLFMFARKTASKKKF